MCLMVRRADALKMFKQSVTKSIDQAFAGIRGQEPEHHSLYVDQQGDADVGRANEEQQASCRRGDVGGEPGLQQWRKGPGPEHAIYRQGKRQGCQEAETEWTGERQDKGKPVVLEMAQ